MFQPITPKQLTPDLWSVTLPEYGTRFFRSLTMAHLFIIEPDNPLFTGYENAPIGGTIGASN